MLEFENYDLEDIVTPVKAGVFKDLFLESGYPQNKIQYLFEGFSIGFDMKYEGPLKGTQRFAANLKLRVGTPVQLWNKVMAEVKLGRFAGPLLTPPFDHFVQSPIGLVPKDKGLKTRLIFHLSYPKVGHSVNSGIPKECCTVKYPDFEDVVRLCMSCGKSCVIGKSDMSSAFRQASLRKDQWCMMVMKAKHPITGVVYYFVDKCLPFGSSISCAIFQEISNAISHVVSFQSDGRVNINYLDDYLFTAAMKALCDGQLKTFLRICEQINFLVALEKTFWGSTLLVFLGLLLDTDRQVVCIPLDKIDKALDLVEYFLNKRNKKFMVLQVQKFCGSLNFLCKYVVPGRASLRRFA